MNSPVGPEPAPVLTVLLPVRNGEATLACALTSLLRQTFVDFEIIVLDDGSTDSSASVAARFGDQRIRIVSDGVQSGLVSRLNEGVALARGHFIARMDADDVSFQQRFDRQITFLRAHPEVDLLGCRAVAFRNEGTVIGLLPFAATHEELCARPWNNIPLPHPGWMGRTVWFRANPYRIPEVLRAEDQELLLRASQHSRYGCLDEVLLGYRQGDFDLRRTLRARMALWSAQRQIFLARRQYMNLLLASAVSGLKVVIDILAVLPGAKSFWFFRMAAPASPGIQDLLRTTLEMCADCGTSGALAAQDVE
ncbi:MAG: hypothetical protein JWQ72_3229 [Polaromonas sp.]|nr:hypothetical protein [Polaromonas sp.]